MQRRQVRAECTCSRLGTPAMFARARFVNSSTWCARERDFTSVTFVSFVNCVCGERRHFRRTSARGSVTTSYLLLTTCYLLLAAYYSLLTTYYSLLTTYYLLLTTYYLLLTTHYSLLTTYYSLLTTYYLLLTTHYLLLTTYYSLGRVLTTHHPPLIALLQDFCYKTAYYITHTTLLQDLHPSPRRT